MGGTITDGEFVTAMVLILTSLALMRISFARAGRRGAGQQESPQGAPQHRQGQAEGGVSPMPDLVNNAFWYTVWDAKTGDLLASGTAAMCARRLGYASANSFAASVCHWFKDGRQHVKYICQRELIPRSEVDSLPRKQKRPARVRSTDEPKG